MVHIFKSQQFLKEACLISAVTVIFIGVIVLRQALREQRSQTRQGSEPAVWEQSHCSGFYFAFSLQQCSTAAALHRGRAGTLTLPVPQQDLQCTEHINWDIWLCNKKCKFNNSIFMQRIWLRGPLGQGLSWMWLKWEIIINYNSKTLALRCRLNLEALKSDDRCKVQWLGLCHSPQ